MSLLDLLPESLALPQTWLAWLLDVFAGEFLYLGAGSLLPEAQGYPSANVLGAMAAGAGLVVALPWML